MSLDSIVQFVDHLDGSDTTGSKQASTKLSAAAHEQGAGSQSQPDTSTNQATLENSDAPPVSIDGTVTTASDSTGGQASSADSSSGDHWYSKALRVGDDIGSGAVDELVDHTGRVLGSAAIGVATGVAAGFLGPGVLKVAGAVGTAYLGYKAYENAGTWINDAKVVASPQSYSAAQLSQAQAGLQAIGGGMVDLAAGAGGFGASSALRAAGFGFLSSAAGSVETPLDTTTTSGLIDTAESGIETAQSMPIQPARIGVETGAAAPIQPTNAALERADAVPVQTSAIDSAKMPGDHPAGTSRTGLGKGRTPEERSRIVNLLANGNIDDITTGKDAGLDKDIMFGKAVASDGTSTDAFIRPIDTSDPFDLSRIKQAQIEAAVDSLTGVDSGAPESAMRQIELAGKPQWVAVQENAGKSLGANLTEWTKSAYGRVNDTGMVPAEDVQSLIEAHPALKESIGNGLFQVLYQGNPDLLNLSNLAVRGSQDAGSLSLDEPMQIPIIDAKFNWSPGPDVTEGVENPTYPAPNWGQNAAFGQATRVVKLYAGKPLSEISPALQERAEGIQSYFQSAAGRTELLKAGLTNDEINAATSRLNYLTTKGYPPLYATEDPELWTVSGPEFSAANKYAMKRSASLRLSDVMQGQ